MNPLHLLVIWARRRLVFRVCLATVLAVLVVSLVMPKKYTASASLIIDAKPDPIAGMVPPEVVLPTYLASQLEVIQSDRVAERAVKLLGEDRTRAAMEKLRSKAEGKVPVERYYGTVLRKGLSAKVTPGSNIIVLTFSANDPGFATAAANAFAQAYLETSIDMRVEPAKQYAAWFDDRLDTLHEAMAKTQSRLSSYQREKGIVATDERYDQESTRLAALNEKLAALQGKRIEAMRRGTSADSELSPEVMDSTVIQGIKAQLSKAQARLSEISPDVGTNHPVRVQLESQIAGLKQQLSEEARRISGSAMTASRVAAQEEADLRALIEAQKRKVLSLLPEHDEIAVLTKDVETARHAYDNAAQRRDQISLESKSDQTNVHMLNWAIVPDQPASPRVFVNLVLGLAAGLLLGGILALALEAVDRRVRQLSDLAVTHGVPVLGALRGSRPASLVHRLPVLAQMRTPLLGSEP